MVSENKLERFLVGF